MLYKNPTLYIFDEVTSALDAGSEKNVMSTLIELSKKKTCIMIAHRLNTIKHADHIIVLSKHGDIIEQAWSEQHGKSAHEQLLTHEKGYYKKLFEDQTF